MTHRKPQGTLPPVPDFIEQRARAGKPKWSLEEAKAYLASCPQVMVLVPKEPWEEQLQGVRMLYVGWNGHPFFVQKGEAVMVPLPIAQIIAESQRAARTDQMRTQDPTRMLISSSRPMGLDVTGEIGGR